MKTKKNIKDIALTSFVVSFFLYIVSISFYVDSYINERELEFGKFSRALEQYKQVVFFSGKIIENKVNRFKSIRMVSNNEVDQSSRNFEHFDGNEELTNIDIAAGNEFKQLILDMPTTLPEHDVMYYRSYISSAAAIDKEGADTQVGQCVDQRNCSIDASERRLRDRILISDPYTNKDGSYFITVSSPVYYKGSVVGDVNIDISLGHFDTASKIKINKSDINGVDFYEFAYGFGNDTSGGKFAYSIDYVADNSTVYVYKVSVISIVVETLVLFVAIWLICGYVLFRFKELDLSKIKLIEVESTIIIDQMTDLLNRNVLENADFKNAIKEKGASILAIDGNKLKTINDTYGHHVGDEAIKQIAEAMKEVFRDTDYLIRSGGDEFLAVLPGCKEDNATRLAERLKECVSQSTFSPYSLSVGVSVGVAEMMENEPVESAIRRADEKLYKDKQA